MKTTYFLILTMLFSTHCFSSNTEFYWVKAMKYCNERNYEQGEIFFDLAVEEMEREHEEDDYSFIYLNRGKLYSILGMYNESLRDLNKCLTYDSLYKYDRLKAVYARATVYYKLGMEEECAQDIRYFNEHYSCLPQVKISNEYIIVRNIDTEECTEVMLKLLLRPLVSKDTDIEFLSSHTCIAKRKKCGPCCGNACQLPTVSRARVTPADRIKGCKTWCDKVFNQSKYFCLAFEKVGCQVVCAVVIEEMHKTCYWCCNEGNFYDKCVKPFENILEQMGKGCDPAFD